MKDENCKSQQDTCEQRILTPKELSKFENCGIEEQIKRLHITIVELRRSLHWAHDSQSRLATKIYALEHHQHSEKGDCMIRIEDTNRDSNYMPGGLDSSIDILA